jgi:tetratricopeptide (TPR) repeat protein
MNRILAKAIEAPAMVVKPSTPAISATTRKIRAQVSMAFASFDCASIAPALTAVSRPPRVSTSHGPVRSGPRAAWLSLGLFAAVAAAPSAHAQITPLGAASSDNSTPQFVAPAPQPLPSPSALTIKDPAEASDYAAAMIVTDPGEQGAALEAFVAKYPQSRVKAEALENAMAAYLEARNLDKVDALSSRVAAVEPDNARALAMGVFVKRTRAASAQGPQADALADAAGDQAQKGLAALVRWRPRQGSTDADGAAVRSEMLATFNGALGYRALLRKDYAAAKTYYLAALKADPSDLDNVYQLSVVLLQSSPVDPAGFWWAARADSMAAAASNSDAQAAIERFVKPRYARYHGGDDGWDGLVIEAGTGLAPPTNFAVTPAASPAAVAVQAVHDAPVSALSFSDWEFILAQRDASPANQAAAAKVWANIATLQSHGLHMKFDVKVIAAGPSGLDGAITDDNQQSGHADLHVKLTAPLAKAPAAGSTVSVTGVLTGYTPTPFAFTMEQAEIVGL